MIDPRHEHGREGCDGVRHKIISSDGIGDAAARIADVASHGEDRAVGEFHCGKLAVDSGRRPHDGPRVQGWVVDLRAAATKDKNATVIQEY